jgi:hypothetical protein
MSASASAIADRVRSIDELDRAIADRAAQINVITYQFLVLVREFDERAGFLRWSFTSCAEWLQWRCDLSPQAARDRVRVAHALKGLPAISHAFERGALSYSKVRALTRVATAGDEAPLLEFALNTTAARVEERVRQMRNGEETSIGDAARVHAARALIATRDARAGLMKLSVALPLEQGELVLQALERALNEHAGSGPEFADTSFRAQQADALVEMAREYLGGSRSGATPGTAEHYQVLIHVDASALSGGNGRSDVPLETARRLTCDGSVVTLTVDGDGEPLNVGRRQRTVAPAIRRAVHARDRHCRFPGCTHTRWLDAHHVRHWSRGGETGVENLVLLCSRHHRLVHEGGYEMRRDQRGEWYFRRADGRAVPAMGYRVEDMTDDDVDVDDAGDVGCASAEASAGCGRASAEAPLGVREARGRYRARAIGVRWHPHWSRAARAGSAAEGSRVAEP